MSHSKMLSVPSHVDIKKLVKSMRIDIRESGLKKLWVLGKSGAGKSALCNALSRSMDCDPNKEMFPEGNDQDRVTTETMLSEIDFLGLDSMPMNLIDTVGIESDNNAEIVAKLTHTLTERCDHANLFALVLNGTMPRIEGRLEMIEILETVFGKENFWQNVVIIFSNMAMSGREVERRKRARKGITDEEHCEKLVLGITRMFNDNVNKNVPYLIIDSKFHQKDPTETTKFLSSAMQLYKMVQDERRCPINTERIQEVLEKYPGSTIIYSKIRVEPTWNRLHEWLLLLGIGISFACFASLGSLFSVSIGSISTPTGALFALSRLFS